MDAAPRQGPRRPTILPVMVGTAGHVDHGKTALVRNLTGCETDTLREEQARGLTIDLGFAPCALSARRLCGIVDVPGHKDFIRNMVAGAASMDVVILVVAADDGVMPQTVEHLRIVSLLRRPRLVVALTKIDLVDEEAVARARRRVAELVGGFGFGEPPIIGVSNESMVGIQALRETLDAIVGEIEQPTELEQVFRMSVERTFSVTGHGTVVTGIPVTGKVRVGDAVELLPSGARTTVRGIQSYRIDSEEVVAHVCGALVLRDLDARDVRRGMVVATPGVFRPATTAVVRLENVTDSQTLKRTSPLKFHSGTAVVNATGRLIQRTALPPWESAYLLLRFAEPVVLAAGDTYVVRSPAPPTTVGGGPVLCVQPQARLRDSDSAVLERLEAARRALDRADPLTAELLLGPLAIAHDGDLVRFTQLRPAAARRIIDAKRHQGELIGLGGMAWILPARRAEFVTSMVAALGRYHAANPHAWGIEPGHASALFGLGPAASRGLVEIVRQDPRIVFRNGHLALATFSPRLSPRQAQLMDEIRRHVRAAGISPPARGDLMRCLGIDDPDMTLLTRLLVEEGTVRIVGSNLLLGSLFEELRQRLVGLFETRPVVDIAAFRAATGLNRRMAQAVLESFDVEGLTRRVESGRVLLAKSARRPC